MIVKTSLGNAKRKKNQISNKCALLGKHKNINVLYFVRTNAFSEHKDLNNFYRLNKTCNNYTLCHGHILYLEGYVALPSTH